MVNFSVLLSLYQRESPENLFLALESISNQTLEPKQVVVVFDGPVGQELEDVVSVFNNRLNNLTIVHLEQNIGLGRALNHGISFCNYEFIARMDTDDICYPERFEKQMDYLIKNQKVSVLGCTIQEFEKEPNDLGVFRKLPLKLPEILKFARFRNPLNHPSVVFKKSAVLAVGSYQDMPLFEDFYLWIRMLEKGYRIENLQEPLLHFRIGNDMIGRRHGFSYLRKEFVFLTTIKKSGFINETQYLLSLLIKAPLRLVPKVALKFFYKKVLR